MRSPRWPAAVVVGVTLGGAAWGAAPSGLAVLALDGAAQDAWPLARRIYTDPLLRPPLDEPMAEALAGAPSSSSWPSGALAVHTLRAAIKGEDEGSRQLLTSIAELANVNGVVVVWPRSSASPAHARLFWHDRGAFDEAVLLPEAMDSVGSPSWPGAVEILHSRALMHGGAPIASSPPSSPPWGAGSSSTFATAPLAVVPLSATASSSGLGTPATAPKSEPFLGGFWKSPWFWAAVGLAGIAVTAAVVGAKVNASNGSQLVPVMGTVAP